MTIDINRVRQMTKEHPAGQWNAPISRSVTLALLDELEAARAEAKRAHVAGMRESLMRIGQFVPRFERDEIEQFIDELKRGAP